MNTYGYFGGLAGIFALLFAIIPLVVTVWALLKLRDIAFYSEIQARRLEIIESYLEEIAKK